MQFKSSWYNYLIAGGLFWLPQLFLIASYNQGFMGIIGSGELKTTLDGYSDPVLTLLTTAVIALVTLIILITGAILDLLMSGMPIYEVSVFYRHLSKNKPWAEKALQKYALYVQEDYDTLVQNMTPEGRYVEDKLIPLSRNSNNSSLKELLQWGKGRKSARLAFNRLYNFIVVRAVSKSSDEPPELLIGPLQAWQFARILTGSISFLALEMMVVPLIIEFIASVATNPTVIGIGLASGFISIFLLTTVTERGFDRVCLVLFSLWYNFEQSEEMKPEVDGHVGNLNDKRQRNNTRKQLKKPRTKPTKNGDSGSDTN
jgi:hypothetical protein